MGWLPIDVDAVFRDVPDFAESLDVTDHEAVGLLIRLWGSIRDSYGPTDPIEPPNLLEMSPRKLAAWCRWGGPPDVLRTSLTESVWISPDGVPRGWRTFIAPGLEKLRADRLRKRQQRSTGKNDGGPGKPPTCPQDASPGSPPDGGGDVQRTAPVEKGEGRRERVVEQPGKPAEVVRNDGCPEAGSACDPAGKTGAPPGSEPTAAAGPALDRANLSSTNGPGDGLIAPVDRSSEAVDAVEAYLEILRDSVDRANPRRRKLAADVRRLRPLGRWRDSGAPVLEASAAVRDRVKAGLARLFGHEFAAQVVIFHSEEHERAG